MPFLRITEKVGALFTAVICRAGRERFRPELTVALENLLCSCWYLLTPASLTIIQNPLRAVLTFLQLMLYAVCITG